MRPLKRAVVLGAGVMGAQIAAHLANAGVEVDLLDIVPAAPSPEEAARGLTLADRPVRDRFALGGLERLRTLKPSPVFSAASLERIHPGNVEDDLERVRLADWVIEAIVEQLEPKRQLWERVEPLAAPEAVLSSNTSGLSLAAIARGRGDGFRRRFLGTHFFNPPRYMKLLEVIPTAETDPAVVETVRAWGERLLGKGIVVARDTPNFIGNRIGVYALHVTLQAMEQFGLNPETVDALTGPVVGHPKSATFRTLDVVGLDTMVLVADNIREKLEDPAERAVFEVPGYVREMIRRGWLGQKSGQGFYKRVEAGGRRDYLVLDLATFEYRPQEVARFPSLESARRQAELGERLRTLAYADDAAGRFTWTVLKRLLLYAAAKAEEIAGGDLEAIDRALRWGFNWEAGPFEIWAELGLARSVARMREEGEAVPDWVLAAVERGEERLYAPSPTPSERYPVAPVLWLERQGRTIWENPGATLVDLGEEVAALEFHAPKDAIGPDLIEALHRAAREVERNWRGLVLVNERSENFCVGANLALILMAAESGDWASIEQMVDAFQQANMELKYLHRPVVAAPWGMALGGGAEICLHADRVQAGAELYVGQVEAGAGVIPAGGGTKELLLRALARIPAGASWGPIAGGPSAGSGAMAVFDPAPFVARAFETIATAKVSTSAVEARELGFLRECDGVSMGRDALLSDAREQVLLLDRLGYRPPERRPVPVPGREVRAVLDVAVDYLVRSRQASEHDARIARALARVITGGDLPQGTPVDEQHLLDLEREAFLSLVGEPKTRERMQHLLETGRPLRN
ncbi:MAG: 3-hydroxyacyl-CoA dehydrogenase/enoyl-CoA hydratase family protein [Bacillota bacterium]|nr:3-hydroxyacyl-CoA dehydrogenase/enoyl-CoA hydratase family protein [Bacillota bacterium]